MFLPLLQKKKKEKLYVCVGKPDIFNMLAYFLLKYIPYCYLFYYYSVRWYLIPLPNTIKK